MPANAPLPKCLTALELISGGATGWVFKVESGIALKYSITGLKEFQKENNAYDYFEQGTFLPSPHILQSFLRLTGINFMPLMECSLSERIVNNQRRDYKKGVCLEVLRFEPLLKIEQWAMEIAEALAWLESLNLVHGDLRPANILLDRYDHLKLADFDSVAKIGSENPGNGAPWSREVGPEGGPEIQGTHGLYGARTEQFAFGSILYNLTQGVELYEERGAEALRLLQDLVFPELPDSPLNGLTVRCWKGDFDTLADLVNAVSSFEGAAQAAQATRFDYEYVEQKKARCHELLGGRLAGIQFENEAGLLDTATTR